MHFLVWLCFPPAAAGRIDPVVLLHRHRFVFSKCQTSAFSPEGHEPNILQTSIRILRLSSPLPVVGPLVVRPGKKKNLPRQTAAGFYLRTCECLHPSGRLLILFFLLLRGSVFITRRRRLLSSSFFPFPSSIQSSRRDNGNVFLAIVSQPLSCLRPNPRTPPPLAALTQVHGLRCVTSYLLSAAVTF